METKFPGEAAAASGLGRATDMCRWKMVVDPEMVSGGGGVNTRSMTGCSDRDMEGRCFD